MVTNWEEWVLVYHGLAGLGHLSEKGRLQEVAVSRSKGDLPREHLGASGRYPLPRSSPPRPNTYLCPSPIVSKIAGVQIAPSDLLPSHP